MATGASKTACTGCEDVIVGERRKSHPYRPAPPVMAVFRNMAVSLLGLLGFDCPSEGLRHFEWNPEEAIRIVAKRPKPSAQAT